MGPHRWRRASSPAGSSRTARVSAGEDDARNRDRQDRRRRRGAGGRRAAPAVGRGDTIYPVKRADRRPCRSRPCPTPRSTPSSPRYVEPRGRGGRGASAGAAGRVRRSPTAAAPLRCGAARARTPVLLIHGFGGDLDTWQITQATLAVDRAVYAIDLPGHGESTKEIGPAISRSLPKRSGRPWTRSGSSGRIWWAIRSGAGTALQLALAHPGRVASLALIAPVGLAEGIDPTFPAEFLAATKTRDLQRCLGRLFADPSMVSRELAEQVARNKRLDGAEVGTLEDRQRPASRKGASARSCCRPSRPGSPRIRAIPVAVVWGEEDAILSPDPLGQLPASVVTLLLSGVGHMPQLEAAKEVNAILSAHVGGAA